MAHFDCGCDASAATYRNAFPRTSAGMTAPRAVATRALEVSAALGTCREQEQREEVTVQVVVGLHLLEVGRRLGAFADNVAPHNRRGVLVGFDAHADTPQ